MIEKLDVITMDLDTTICDTSHRQSMIDRDKINGPEFWERYSLECVNDTPGPALPMAQQFTRSNQPWYVVSGRSEVARSATRKWLWDYECRPHGIILCDDRHNYMPHGLWKATRLLELQNTLYRNIAYHVDDYLDVFIETAKVGIKTVLVHGEHSNIVSALG